MKFITINFRERNREVGYMLTNSGITISSIQGLNGSMEDNLTLKERNELIISILTSVDF